MDADSASTTPITNISESTTVTTTTKTHNTTTITTIVTTITKIDTNPTANINSNQICTICMEEISKADSIKLPCNHEFDSDCIMQWAFKHYNCPICRYHLPENAPVEYMFQKLTHVLTLDNYDIEDWKPQTIGLMVAILVHLKVYPETSTNLFKPFISQAWENLYSFIVQEYESLSESEAEAEAEVEWRNFKHKLKCPYCSHSLRKESRIKDILVHLDRVLRVSPDLETVVPHTLCIFLSILYFIDRDPNSSVEDAKLFFEPAAYLVNSLLVLIGRDKEWKLLQWINLLN